MRTVRGSRGKITGICFSSGRGAAVCVSFLAVVLALCAACPRLSALERGSVMDYRLSRKMSVDFQDVHIRTALGEISRSASVSIVIDESIFSDGGGMLASGMSPDVTVSLRDVPVLGVIEIILRMKNLSLRVEGNLVRVGMP